MTDSLAEFRAAHGKAWYLFCHSALGKAAFAALRLAGPASRMIGLSASDTLTHGPIFCANQQGWMDAIGAMEFLMPLSDAPEKNELEPTYQPEGDESQKPRKKRK